MESSFSPPPVTLILALALLPGACAAAATPTSPKTPSTKPRPVPHAVPGATAQTTPKRTVPAASAPPPNPVATPAPSEAETPKYPFNEPIPAVSVLLKGSAMQHANWSPAHCRRQLAKFKKDAIKRQRGSVKGIATPLRVVGEIRGVRFRSHPEPVSFGLLDCRLLFALADFAQVLERHQVAEVRIDNYYRNRARLPGKKSKSQHAYGLAADIVSFTQKDGTVLNIEEDWHGAVGAPTCGPDARLTPHSDKALRLRNLVCDFARTGIFHHILTPNFNAAHRDHLHVDIKRDNKWFSLD